MRSLRGERRLERRRGPEQSHEWGLGGRDGLMRKQGFVDRICGGGSQKILTIEWTVSEGRTPYYMCRSALGA